MPPLWIEYTVNNNPAQSTQSHVITLSPNDSPAPAIILVCFMALSVSKATVLYEGCAAEWRGRKREQEEGMRGGGFFYVGGGWKQIWSEEFLQSVIINLSGMQPLLLPDKLLHGFSGLASTPACITLSTDLCAAPRYTHTHTHTHTHMHAASVTSVSSVWWHFGFICVIIVLQCYCCLFLSLSLPTWYFSATLPVQQQTKGTA